MPDLHANFATSTIVNAPSPATSGNTLTVTTGTGALYPTPPFNATVWPPSVQPSITNAEIVRVTAISGDSFTVTRAQENTSAQSIGSSYQIDATITAKTFTDIESNLSRLPSYYNVRAYGAKGDGSTDDSGAIQAASNAATAAGGGVVYFPEGNYIIKATPVTPTSNVIYRGVGEASVIQQTGTNGYPFYWATSAPAVLNDVVFENLSFLGPVNQFPTAPTRGRTTSGLGTYIAIYLIGNLDVTNTTGVITNVTIRDCIFRNIIHTPIYLDGINGKCIVTDNEFTNNMDVGFIDNQEVIFNNNHVQMSADNGVSISRGNNKATCVGNTFENICFSPVWFSGFGSQNGAVEFTCVGNIMKSFGQCGVLMKQGPTYGVVSGNVIDKNYYQGPVDSKGDGLNSGIYIQGTSGNMNSPSPIAIGISVTGNTIRNCYEAGVLLSGVNIFNVVSNLIIDTGLQYHSNGTTLVSSTDVTFNNGICMQGSYVTNGLISNNTVIDSRSTPYMNYGITPSTQSSVSIYGNTVTGARTETSYTSTLQVNSKITNLTNGSASSDAAAFGQIPTSASSIGGLLAANNLSDVASTATSLTNIGAVNKAGDTMTGPLLVGSYAGSSTGIEFQSTNTTVNTARFINTGVAGSNGGAGIVGILDTGVAIASGDRLGFAVFGGAQDAAHSLQTSGGIEVYATEAWSGTNRGTQLKFRATTTGSTTKVYPLILGGDSSATFLGNVITQAGAIFHTLTKATNYTLLPTDFKILVDSTSAALTMTLPTAASVTGQTYIIKDWKGQSATHNITIVTTSSQTIDGATSIVMATNYEGVEVTSDGANWSVTAQVATSIL